MSTDPRSYHGASFKVVSDQAVSEAPRLPLATLYQGSETVSRDLQLDLQRGKVNVDYDSKSTQPQQREARSSPFSEVATYSCYARLAGMVTDDREEAIRALAAAIAAAPRHALPEGVEPVPSMYVYFGQFLAHEVSKLYIVENNEPKNLVTPSLDLDSFFWKTQPAPPGIQSDFSKFDVRHAGNTGVGLTTKSDSMEHHDLPRDEWGTPLVPDKRSDSNLSLAQLQTRMTLNYLGQVDALGEEEAQVQFVEKVQVVTLYDYLRKIINDATYCDVLENGRKIVSPGKGDPGQWLLPLEFSAAAYRFGHAMVRDSYQWSALPENKPQKLIFLLRRTHILGYLREREPLLNKVLSTHWKMEMNDMIGHAAPNNALPLGPCLAAPLDNLDERLVDNATEPVNLAQLTLELGRKTGLASAQQFWSTFEKEIGGALLTPSQLIADQSDAVKAALETGKVGETLAEVTPLWYYTLREAQMTGNGIKLGPLAGRIVMETLHAAICAQRKGPPPPDSRITLADLLS